MGEKKQDPIAGLKSFAASSGFKASASGFVVTLSLFYLMAQLISGGANLNKSDDTENFIEFVRVKKNHAAALTLSKTRFNGLGVAFFHCFQDRSGKF